MDQLICIMILSGIAMFVLFVTAMLSTLGAIAALSPQLRMEDISEGHVWINLTSSSCHRSHKLPFRFGAMRLAPRANVPHRQGYVS